MTVHFQEMPQTSGPYRLGRHVLHDPRSRDFDASQPDERGVVMAKPRPLVSTFHSSVCPPWDQGQIGSCTANAALGCLMTKPVWNGHWRFSEPDALGLYEQETKLDDRVIPGEYPPDDTGSTGLWSMKALKAAGYIRAYRHAFSTSTVLHLLLDGPVSTGIPWLDSMFEVDRSGTIVVDESTGVAGGHQICLVGLDTDRRAVRVRNSWGTGWGQGGYAWLAWDDYDALLHQQGDAVVPVI